MLGLDNWKVHDFPKLQSQKLLHKMLQIHPAINWHLQLMCRPKVWTTNLIGYNAQKSIKTNLPKILVTLGTTNGWIWW
jgi:hypothetical protein